MPSIELLIPSAPKTDSRTNPLPSLLQTPSGLAILEIQGTIHGPFQNHAAGDDLNGSSLSTIHPLGRLEFPLYNAQAANDDGKWMKKAYLYIGKYQRLTGEVKKLAKPLAVIRKVEQNGNDNDDDDHMGMFNAGEEALEVVEIIKFKVMFSARPEPVGE